MLLAERAESERLRQIIKELQRHRFGRRAESLPEEQLQLGLEEVQQVEAEDQAKIEENAPAERHKRVARRRANRGALPAHHDHPELRRHDVEPLGDVFPDPMQLAGAAGADFARHIDQRFDARQVRR